MSTGRPEFSAPAVTAPAGGESPVPELPLASAPNPQSTSPARPLRRGNAPGARPPPRVPDHVLLRCVGQGAYGEVWLARNVMGVYRAVKVVYRDDFPDDRPYDREFRGIQKFEPVSRTHDSQVDILHVGRGDAEGYFYYVMELADDATADPSREPINPTLDRIAPPVPQHSSAPPALNPDTYVPKTLKSELTRAGKLPLDRCLEIALSLATALEHLHANGLVHRDVKPSNIIFINGQPKLADIGLVADVDATVSFVGTEGYIPPEGPGTPQADIYSLGKVLYEICTGKPRRDFPEPPTQWEGSEEEPALREFHEILLKACEREPRQRYQRAREMRAEVALLQSGRSVRQLHVLQQRVKWLIRSGLVGTTLLMVVTAGYLFAVFEKREAVKQSERADREAKRALAAEQGMQERLRAVARANRLTQEPGRRFESLEMLKKAASINPSLEVRNEAVACLTLPDLCLGEALPCQPGISKWNELDENFERYAHIDYTGSNERATVSVREVEGDREVATLPALGMHFNYPRLWMSPNGRFVAIGYTLDDGRTVYRLWRVERREKLLELTGSSNLSFDFSRDSRWAALGQSQGPIIIFDLDAGKERNRLPSGLEPLSLRFSRDGRKLAVSRENPNVVEVRETETGALLCSLPHARRVEGMDWHPDGERLATSCFDSQVYLWNTATTNTPMILKGHTAEVVLVAFANGGDILASYGWDESVRLWDTWTGKQLVNLPTGSLGLHFSADDRRLGSVGGPSNRLCLLEVATGRECRLFGHHSGRRLRSGCCSADGRLLATLGEDGVRLWDLAGSKEVAFVPVDDAGTVILHPDGKNLLTCGPQGIVRWPLTSRQRDGTISCEVGRAETLDRNWVGGAVVASDGSLLFAAGGAGVRRIYLDEPAKAAVLFPETAGVVAASADGNWFAVGTPWRDSNPRVTIWDAHSGKVKLETPILGTPSVAFSPDSHWVAVADSQEFRFWATDDWKEQVVPREKGSEWASPLVFSPDGTMLAISHRRRGIHLLQPGTWRELVTLSEAEQWPVCFTPDGNGLIAADDTDTCVRVWDLRLIRQELAASKLDWEAPPLPPVEPVANRPGPSTVGTR